jgi:hypothetical protein
MDASTQTGRRERTGREGVAYRYSCCFHTVKQPEIQKHKMEVKLHTAICFYFFRNHILKFGKTLDKLDV